jgi:DNA-binding CsgD family transcriptional regulator
MPAKLNEYTSENVREEAVKVLTANGFSEDEIQEIHDLPSRQNRQNYGPLNIHKRRLMVNQLVAANFSNEQISEVLRMSKETVNKDREYARNLYTRNILQTADMHRARLLEEAIDLKNQALEAFQQSKRKVTRTVKEGGDGEGSDGEQIITIQESAGDVGFLNVAKNLIAEQAKIVGLNNLPAAAKEEKSYHDFLRDLSATLAKADADADEQRAKELAIEIEFAEAENIGPEGTQLLPSSIDEKL